jgi:hypothetical protein
MPWLKPLDLERSFTTDALREAYQKNAVKLR